MRKLNILGNERGGVEVIIFTLIALLLLHTQSVLSLDYIILYNSQNKLKNDLMPRWLVVYQRNPAFQKGISNSTRDNAARGAGYVL